MFIILALSLFPSQIPDTPKPKPQLSGSELALRVSALELQGDKLGETPEIFQEQHPKAECDKSQNSRITCYQWGDVSIFGLMAQPASGCNLKKRYAVDCLQGLTARFKDGQLVSLVYTVAGSDKTVASDALKKQFGAPTMDTRDGSVWNNRNGTISVVVGKAMQEKDAPSMLTISLAETY
jgi:hypothetical protein